MRNDKKQRKWKLAKSTPRKGHLPSAWEIRVHFKRHILNEVPAPRLHTSSSNWLDIPSFKLCSRNHSTISSRERIYAPGMVVLYEYARDRLKSYENSSILLLRHYIENSREKVRTYITLSYPLLIISFCVERVHFKYGFLKKRNAEAILKIHRSLMILCARKCRWNSRDTRAQSELTSLYLFVVIIFSRNNTSERSGLHNLYYYVIIMSFERICKIIFGELAHRAFCALSSTDYPMWDFPFYKIKYEKFALFRRYLVY